MGVKKQKTTAKQAIIGGYFLCLLLLCLCLAGCGESREEKIARYKQAGIEAMDAQDYKTAVQQFDAAMQLYGGRVNEEVVDLCYYKAAALFDSGEAGQAADVYSALIAYDKSNAAAFFLRGSLYLDEGEKDKALADYENALQQSDGDYEMYLRIAGHLTGSGQESDARRILEQGLDRKDDSGSGYLGRGRIYLALGEADKAAAQLETAAEKKERDADVYLAQAYEALGESEKASQLLLAYAKDEDPSGEALAMLGRIETENGNYEQALAFYRQGLEKEPLTNEQELRRGEIIALEYAGRFAEAKEKMEEYIKMYPSDAEALREETFLSTR